MTVRIGISNAGLVGGLVGGLLDTTNQLVCTLLGPNFLKLLLDECDDCFNGILLPTEIKSHIEFCALFNRLPADKQKCVTDGAIRLKLPSVLRFNFIIGQCCAHCAKESKFDDRKIFKQLDIELNMDLNFNAGSNLPKSPSSFIQ